MLLVSLVNVTGIHIISIVKFANGVCVNIRKSKYILESKQNLNIK